MNILYFTHEKEYGGSSKALVYLIKDVMKNNNVYVVTPFKDAKVCQELKKMGIPIINCFYSWWQVPKNISKLKKFLFKCAYKINCISRIILKHKIKKLNIDIIHSNTSVIDMGAIVAKDLNIKHIWHFREFTDNNLAFIKGKEKSYDFINKYGGNVIYISKSIEKFYKNNNVNNCYKLIYDGVDASFIDKDKVYEEDLKKIIFLLAGTLEKGKGQYLAIEAIGKLVKEGITNISLILAGGDKTGYTDHLKYLIKKYNIEEYVEFKGFVKDMKNLRKNVNVELICSESEAFGLVTVESMLAGNLIIGSNSGATAEIIKDNISGILYKCNDSTDLANKMKQVIKDTTIIKSIGKKAQKYAIDNFLSDKNSTEIMNYYNEIYKR